MRRLLSLLIVLAFAARSFVPAGTMLVAPSADGLGGPALVICTGQGPMTVQFDADGKPIPSKPAQSNHDICVFAASVHAAIETGSTAQAVATVWQPVAVIKPVSTARDLRSAQAAPPPARGPPAFPDH